ncbi:MAG: nuclear transport factor 2 family protein [Solirubrobacteraceae bacterium]
MTGIAGALAARALLPRLLLLKLNHDVRRLNAGEHEPLLASYARDAVLRFNEGPHRWAGEHRGKAEIDRFLRNFTAAGIQGEIRELWIAGPPWALTMVVRFNDYTNGPDGRQIYANRTVLVIRTRWGKIVEHEDFYEDTQRILALEQRLRELGIAPVDAGNAERRK